ncbi:MAG: EamA family transporter [Armatimonadetes bacterium]|nr:EamA family transporter [Armatimonadota bacterium]
MAQVTPDVPSPERQTSHLTTYLWLATVPLTWGFNFVALKILYGTYHFSVTGLLSARYVLMVPLLAVLLWVTERDRGVRREHWRYLGLFALVTVGIYQYLFAKAIELTSAGESALLISSAPIFTFLITAALGWEKPTRLGFVGVICGFAGIALVIFGGNGSANVPPTHVLGDLVMIAASVLWAAYAIFSKPLLKHYSPLKVTAWAHILGAVIIIPVGWRPMVAVDWVSLPWPGWACVLYFAWLAGVYGFVVWYRGVRAIGAHKTMLFQYLVPPVALVVGYFVLREAPSAWQMLGVVLTLTGVYVASTARRETT